MSTPIVIVPCGAKKRAVRCRAGEMYTGNYHRACMCYARFLTCEKHIFILSAKWSLVRPNYEVEPYERHMSQNYRDDEAARRFWQHLGATLAVFDMDNLVKQHGVILLGGRDYTDILESHWRDAGYRVQVPLRGRGGLVAQLNWLRAQIRAAQSKTNAAQGQ